MESENTHTKYSMLVIDDEQRMCDSIKHLLCSHGFNVYTANQAKTGMQVLQKRNIDLVLCDIVMPDMSGLVLLDKINKNVPVIMMTAYASIETTRKAFKLGAKDYLVKPFELEELLVVIDQNLKQKDLHEGNAGNVLCFRSNNSSFKNMLELAEKFSKTEMPILITGESGTGKEVIAKYIHEKSNRRNYPLISINCAAIPETLLESELFGYEKGAFTGAQNKKTGKVKEAEKGTLFLDEIADMPFYLQAKILRFLQDFTFYPLGSDKPCQVDTRIIAASNKNLSSLINTDGFREDLYHRLNGLHLKIPALRERGEDFSIFIDFFFDQFNRKYKRDIKSIDKKTIEKLTSYNWPGNIRELRNCIERAVVVCEEELLLPEHLPDTVRNTETAAVNTLTVEKNAVDYKDEYMRKIILDTLARANGNRSEAAQLLNISRRTLYNRMRELNIKYVFK